ncbi:bifunctional 40S ribosomal protein S1-3 [Babesia duncani]|uniref:Small ribosomal subunit protein eS1 n=1 Tax=Babesia duncani TaxID=323732 RepID=A0AAD9UNL1_9APIC|nr:bifunctional 40S ribosomal protein S1-3 [Babesia duncani]
MPGGKKKPLKAPKKIVIQTEDDIEFKKKELAERKAMEAARKELLAKQASKKNTLCVQDGFNIIELAIDGLRGRVFEVSLADLNADEDQAYRKIKLCCEDVQGRNCLTDFHGYGITRDKLCSLIRKNYSLIEAFTDVKTTDGYMLRMFCIGYTKKRPGHLKTTCYARTSKIRQIHKKMVEVMTNEASTTTLRELVKKMIPESIGKEIEKACRSIFPLQNVLIRKVKVLKKPKFDLTRLMEAHTDVGEDGGHAMQIKESAEATNLLTAELMANK